MTDFSYIRKPDQFEKLIQGFREKGPVVLAMDFEEESNLHVYGEHLCIIQLSDGENFYIIDALAIGRTEKGAALIKDLLEGPEVKIMFDCSSDSAIVRKSLGIHLKNIYDIRLAAKALGFDGNLTSLTERCLGVIPESSSEKKKYQMANWMKRPIPEDQLNYALNDVKYLLSLKASLEAEMEQKLTPAQKRHLAAIMKQCARQKHRDRPGWEKICNYQSLTAAQKVYIRRFFNARDVLAREANVPPTNILEKQKIVAMAKAGTWEGLLEAGEMRYAPVFEKARVEAEREIKTPLNRN